MTRALAIAALLLVVAAPGGAAQDGRGDQADIELRSDVVLVNVVARRGTAFAAGLTLADFRVDEDGAPQEIAFFGAETTPFAAAILLDTSGSMEHRLTLARAAVARFADRTRVEDRLAVYLFGDEVKRIQDFLPGRRDLADSLWDAVADGNTKMYDCLDAAAEALSSRPEQRRAIVLLSDGADSGSRVSRDAVLNRALAAGITIYTIDVAPAGGGTRPIPGNEQFIAYGALRALAEKSGGRFFKLKGGADIDAAFGDVIDELSHQYTLGYYPANGRRDGKWRRIRVETTQKGVSLRARPGYTAPRE